MTNTVEEMYKQELEKYTPDTLPQLHADISDVAADAINYLGRFQQKDTPILAQRKLARYFGTQRDMYVLNAVMCEIKQFPNIRDRFLEMARKCDSLEASLNK
jgi:hypothetical protein